MKQTHKTNLNHHPKLSALKAVSNDFFYSRYNKLNAIVFPINCFMLLTCYYFLLVLSVDYFFSKSSHFCFF